MNDVIAEIKRDYIYELAKQAKGQMGGPLMSIGRYRSK